MATRTPPRYVPTLTEVVKIPPAPVPRPVVPAVTEEQWVHRIMQRVDMTLDRRLREAIAAVVVEQTRNLSPLVREQVEAAVREAVAQALEEELQSTAAARKSST
jgi:hypothetical protein